MSEETNIDEAARALAWEASKRIDSLKEMIQAGNNMAAGVYRMEPLLKTGLVTVEHMIHDLRQAVLGRHYGWEDGGPVPGAEATIWCAP